MPGQRGFFDVDERYRALSAVGDPLERLAAVVDFEVFRADLDAALTRSDRAKGGRPPYDAVLMFKVLVLQVLYGLSDDQAEFQVLDRRSFGRFLGLDDGDRVPDAKTIWLFRERLTRAGAVERLFDRFDRVLDDRGYLAMGGRSSMPLSSRRAGRGSPPPRRRRSRAAVHLLTGRRRSGRRWTGTAAGR